MISSIEGLIIVAIVFLIIGGAILTEHLSKRSIRKAKQEEREELAWLEWLNEREPSLVDKGRLEYLRGVMDYRERQNRTQKLMNEYKSNRISARSQYR